MAIFELMEPMIKTDFISIVIILNVFLGFFISFFIIRNSLKKKFPNLFMGLFILSLSLVMLEGWLNYTGYIFKFLWLSNFSEPLNFMMAGLLYLFIDTQIEPTKKKPYWLHFIPSIIFFRRPFWNQKLCQCFNGNLFYNLYFPRNEEALTKGQIYRRITMDHNKQNTQIGT